VRRWGKGAVRGALSLLRRTAPLLVGVFGRGQSNRTAVWPKLIIVQAPRFDQVARFSEPEKKMSLSAALSSIASAGDF